jgi:hypothetical protein
MPSGTIQQQKALPKTMELQDISCTDAKVVKVVSLQHS